MPPKIPGVWGQSPQGRIPRGGSTLLRLSFAILLRLHRLAEAVAFAIHLEDLAAMRQAIQQSRCHPFTLKHLVPFAECQVAGDEQALAFITIGEHLEEQLGAAAAEREVAELVTDQEVEPIELPED